MLFLRCNQDRRSSGAAANPPPARERSRSPATGRTAAGGARHTTSASPGPASASSWCRPSRHPFLSRLRPRPGAFAGRRPLQSTPPKPRAAPPGRARTTTLTPPYRIEELPRSCDRIGQVRREAPVGLIPGAVLELGELPHRSRPRVAVGGGAGTGSPSVEDDLVKGPPHGEAEFAAVRPGRG